MDISAICGPATQQAASFLTQPSVMAAVVAFAGVLITVIVGTVANFRLAKRRNVFERELAQKRFELDGQLAMQKLEDERAARVAARADSARVRHIDFQRATLLELQEAMLALLRAASQIQLRDMLHSREAGAWTKPLVADDISEENRRLNARTALLISRVHSEHVREVVGDLKNLCHRLVGADSEEGSRSALDDASILFDSFNRDVGKIIRHLDDEYLGSN